MASSSQRTNATQQAQQQSQSVSNPWGPAQGTLTKILGNIDAQIPTALAQTAYRQPQQLALADKFAGGDPTGILDPALKAYGSSLSPIINGDLDPTKNPLLANVLATIRADIGNSVNQQFAGAGRDLSGMNTQTLARGVAQGEATPLLNQFNQNVQNRINAGSQLFGANYNTAGAETSNMAASPGMQQAAISAPFGILGAGANLTVPIAGLGGQTQGAANTSGTSNTNTTYNPSTIALLTALAGGNGLFPGLAGKALGSGLRILGG